MTVFETIRQEMMADPQNESYTKRGIGPLFAAAKQARIVIVGQAPGRIAEQTGLVWNDASGDRLRDWMGVSRETFYDSGFIAQLPMDFYYPGKGKSGDAPPRKGFAEMWHGRLLAEMPDIRLTLLVGGYAQKYYLGRQRAENLTETVRNFRAYLPKYFPLVHPSPLNFRWQAKNPWFERDVVPALTAAVADALR